MPRPGGLAATRRKKRGKEAFHRRKPRERRGGDWLESWVWRLGVWDLEVWRLGSELSGPHAKDAKAAKGGARPPGGLGTIIRWFGSAPEHSPSRNKAQRANEGSCASCAFLRPTSRQSRRSASAHAHGGPKKAAPTFSESARCAPGSPLLTLWPELIRGPDAQPPPKASAVAEAPRQARGPERSRRALADKTASGFRACPARALVRPKHLAP